MGDLDWNESKVADRYLKNADRRLKYSYRVTSQRRVSRVRHLICGMPPKAPIRSMSSRTLQTPPFPDLDWFAIPGERGTATTSLLFKLVISSQQRHSGSARWAWWAGGNHHTTKSPQLRSREARTARESPRLFWKCITPRQT